MNSGSWHFASGFPSLRVFCEWIVMVAYCWFPSSVCRLPILKATLPNGFHRLCYYAKVLEHKIEVQAKSKGTAEFLFGHDGWFDRYRSHTAQWILSWYPTSVASHPKHDSNSIGPLPARYLFLSEHSNAFQRLSTAGTAIKQGNQ